MDTDLVYVKLEPKTWSIVAAATANIFHEIPNLGSYAVVVGPSGMGSTGILKHDATVFGRVVYEGSTTGGFSGAAYMVANRLAGVHQRGGRLINGGYSAGYVWVTLCQAENLKMEATEDWLRNSFKGKKRVRVDQSWGDLDTARIQVDGTYAIVDKKAMRNVFGKDWREGVDSFKVPRPLAYEDEPELESGEARSSKEPGALNVVDASQEGNSTQMHTLINGFDKLSRKQQKAIMRQFEDFYRTTNGQEIMTSKQVLDSIVKGISAAHQN